MQTISSKFFTGLTDFPWPTHAPLFPNQREVYQYLSNYVQQLLPNDIFQLNIQVTNINHSKDIEPHWTIDYSTISNDIISAQFDFVIIATGFFGSSYMPNNIHGLSSFHDMIMHSNDYRSLEQVRNRRVIVAGASVSAAEIVADMATTAQQVIHIATHNFWAILQFIPLIPNDPSSPFLSLDFVSFR